MALDEIAYFKTTILPKLANYFQSCVMDENKSSSEEIILRVNISSEDEAEYFKEVISDVTSTEWIVYRKTSNLQRFSVSKKWICHHSKKNKKKESIRNADCKVKLHIIVKNITKDTLKKDPYLRQNPALRGEIKIELAHSHDTTCAEALKMLRVNSEENPIPDQDTSTPNNVLEISNLHLSAENSEAQNVPVANTWVFSAKGNFSSTPRVQKHRKKLQAGEKQKDEDMEKLVHINSRILEELEESNRLKRDMLELKRIKLLLKCKLHDIDINTL